MELIAGSIILKDNMILMVKETKKDCYSKWSFPAGHVEKGETIFEGAKRETLEETGCKVEFQKAFPVIVHNSEKRGIIMIYFLSDLLEEKLEYFTDEILETKWFTINEIKEMNKDDFRSYSVVESIIESIENKKLYDLETIKNLRDI